MNDAIKVNRTVSVDLPTTAPEGKRYRLYLEGDEVKIEGPVSLRAPRVSLDALERAVSELKALAGEHQAADVR